MRIYANDIENQSMIVFADDEGNIIDSLPCGFTRATKAENNKIQITNPMHGYSESISFDKIKDADGNAAGATLQEVMTYLISILGFKKGGINEILAENITQIQGENGSVQYKNSLGKLSGDSFFKWVSRVLSILGNVVIKGLSSISGNALEIKNSNDVMIAQATNDGYLQVKEISNINDKSNFNIWYDGWCNFRGIYGVGLYLGQSKNLSNRIALFDTDAVYLNKRIVMSATAEVRSQIYTVGNPILGGTTYDLIIRGQEHSSINSYGGDTSKRVYIQDGQPRPDDTGQGYDGLGVFVRSWKKQTGTTPSLQTLIAATEGSKLGFYGTTPVAKQNLPASPTNAEIATVLSNLGFVNLT